jgi:hypothetical protein
MNVKGEMWKSAAKLTQQRRRRSSKFKKESVQSSKADNIVGFCDIIILWLLQNISSSQIVSTWLGR